MHMDYDSGIHMYTRTIRSNILQRPTPVALHIRSLCVRPHGGYHGLHAPMLPDQHLIVVCVCEGVELEVKRGHAEA